MCVEDDYAGVYYEDVPIQRGLSAGTQAEVVGHSAEIAEDEAENLR